MTEPHSRPPRLLACSATKRPDPGRIPARERYDGPLWRILRVTDPDSHLARLTTELAARMIAGGVTTRWPRPPSPRRPDTFGRHASAEIAPLTRSGAEPIVDVALADGRLDLDVMHGFLAGFVGMGCVRPKARVTVINGAIRPDAPGPARWLCEAAPARRKQP